MSDITADLIRDEGLFLKPYIDTAGKTTIGVGRNLSDRGISKAEALNLLAADIAIASSDLDQALPWWRSLDADRQRGLLNMAFNLGVTRLLEFKKMIAALMKNDYATAAQEALDSEWAKQVGERAQRVAALFNPPVA